MPILYKHDITPINRAPISYKQIIAIEGVNLTLNIFTYSTHVLSSKFDTSFARG